MERLFKMEPKALRDRLGDSHNGFLPGNLLQQSDGTLIVNNVGRSGPVGREIPPEKRSPLWTGPTFSFEAEIRARRAA
ncbi:hypothetical protein SPBR_03372 [Sporothrix brasiliensis 5110]|uniref:Uncharacterized protein n=1 Tax=Sporothrix brasiliensis 5110 TaxID=1398154 RepID=A0A0C2J842_9PEZI|nr:uncharacterized protein SPBR_03372 [Sporothrix brasiliensis 5110]KIH93167.1 hypothetical protein SPBR_03372 [Sporothrix brasiliensis 5110]